MNYPSRMVRTISKASFGAMRRFAEELESDAEREAYVLRKGVPELSEWYDSTYRTATTNATDSANSQLPATGGAGGPPGGAAENLDKLRPPSKNPQCDLSGVDNDARCATLTSAGRGAAPLGEAPRVVVPEVEYDFRGQLSLRELGGSRGVDYPNVKPSTVTEEEEMLGEIRDKWEKELEREKRERMDRYMENPWPEESECVVIGKLPNKWQVRIELPDGRMTSCYRGGYNLWVKERLKVKICERLGEDAIYEVVERLPDEPVIKVSPDGHTVAPNGFPDQVMPRGEVPHIVPPVPMENLVEAWKKDAH